MKKLVIIIVTCMLSACYTPNGPISNDPSTTADPICQPRFGLSGCYANGGSE